MLFYVFLFYVRVIFFFFSLIYPPQSRIYTPGTYNPNARGSDACRSSNSLRTRILDIYTRAGLPECMVSTMSGPPPKTTQDRTQTKDTHPIPGQKLKFLTLPGIKPGPLGLEGRDSTDHSTAMEQFQNSVANSFRCLTHCCTKSSPVGRKMFPRWWWGTDSSDFMAPDVGGRLLWHRHTNIGALVR